MLLHKGLEHGDKAVPRAMIADYIILYTVLKNTDTKQPVPTNFKTAVLEVVGVVECPQCSLHGADHVADCLDLILVARLERSTRHRIHFRDLGYCNIVCMIITAR